MGKKTLKGLVEETAKIIANTVNESGEEAQLAWLVEQGYSVESLPSSPKSRLLVKGSESFAPGDIVVIKPEFCNPGEEGLEFIVVEWNTDRGKIAPKEWKHFLRPEELVKSNQITKR